MSTNVTCLCIVARITFCLFHQKYFPVISNHQQRQCHILTLTEFITLKMQQLKWLCLQQEMDFYTETPVSSWSRASQIGSSWHRTHWFQETGGSNAALEGLGTGSSIKSKFCLWWGGMPVKLFPLKKEIEHILMWNKLISSNLNDWIAQSLPWQTTTSISEINILWTVFHTCWEVSLWTSSPCWTWCWWRCGLRIFGWDRVLRKAPAQWLPRCVAQTIRQDETHSKHPRTMRTMPILSSSDVLHYRKKPRIMDT